MLALFDKVVSEKYMFKNKVHIHEHGPGQGQTTPWDKKYV